MKPRISFGPLPCFLRCSRWLVLLLGLAPSFIRAQESTEPGPAEAPPESEPAAEPPNRYNLPVGNGGFNLATGLRAVYVDNVFLTHTAERNDYVIIPEANVAAFFPIGQSNSIALDLGISYYEYLRNTSLNTGTPIISPNSELGLSLRTGDFTFRFTDRFSYQESPVYETGGEFFNIYNSGRFARFENRVGLSTAWDQNDLVVTAAYFHENLVSNGSLYNYIDRASELFSADAMLKLLPRLKAGLESAGSLNRFDNQPLNDSWRASVGPVLRLNPSQFITARFGAGYERIQYDSPAAHAADIHGENSFYAYAIVEHQLRRTLSHSLEVSHRNELGYDAGNLETTQLAYTFTWLPREHLTLSPHATVFFFHESFGSGPPALYHERFTYVRAGLSAQYELSHHWQLSLRWDYRLKDSDVELAGYAQNQAIAEVVYHF